MRHPRLFEEIALGPVRIANRVVFAAHLTNFAVDGLPTRSHTAYYAARAKGGAGLIISEEQLVAPGDRSYEKLVRAYDPAVVEHYRTMTDAVHRHGTPIFAQLNHNGGQASGMYTREALLAPSAVADPLFREVPVAMTQPDIDELVESYARAARHCVAGGFDGVELQCSQSSVLRQFLSRATNVRVDRYGGGIDGRARVLLEVVAAVRSAIGDSKALGVRLAGAERIERGTLLNEAVDVAQLLDRSGAVDYVNTTIGVATASLHLVEPSMATPHDYAHDIPRTIRRAVSIPVVGVGRFDSPDRAERALADGVCDLVGVVRGQIADPDFVGKTAAGQSDRIRACLACNQDCVGRVGKNQRIGCVVNPRAGRESIPLTPTRRRGTVHVVGGGPAGLRAATTAAGLGHRVVLFERSDAIGGQIRTAAKAPGRTGLRAMIDALARECTRVGVDIRPNIEGDAELVRALAPEAVVLATGARPVRPAWAGAARTVVDVRDVLDGTIAPRGAVLVYDQLGFHQGTSVAEFLADTGCAVTIATDAMVVGQDLDSTLDMQGWLRRAESKRIELLTDVVPMSYEAGRLTLLDHASGTRTTRAFDWVVCSVHQRPNDELWQQVRGESFEVHRIGDAITPRRAGAAIREGDSVARACFSVPPHRTSAAGT